MGRLIDTDDLIENIAAIVDLRTLSTKTIGEAIAKTPTVDAIPVVHSEWIPKEKANTPYGLEMECAKCGFPVIVNDALYFKFCPNCGAKMDGKDGDNHD